FFSSRRRHTRWPRDWSSDVCSSDLPTTQRPESTEFLARPSATVAGLTRRNNGTPFVDSSSAIFSFGPTSLGSLAWNGRIPVSPEIGRASCRERVEHTGGGGTWNNRE